MDIPRAGELVWRISAEATARLSPGRQNQFVGEAGAAAFAFGGGDSGGGGASADFSEADGESLTTADDGFEDDLSAS